MNAFLGKRNDESVDNRTTNSEADETVRQVVDRAVSGARAPMRTTLAAIYAERWTNHVSSPASASAPAVAASTAATTIAKQREAITSMADVIYARRAAEARGVAYEPATTGARAKPTIDATCGVLSGPAEGGGSAPPRRTALDLEPLR